MCCLDIWWNQGGPWMAYWQIPLLTLSPWTKSPSKQPFLPRDYAERLAIPAWQAELSRWPAELTQQFSSILPWEPGVISSSWYYKACLYTPWLFTPVPNATPVWAWSCVACRVLLPCKYVITLILPVKHQSTCVQPSSLTLEWESLSH